MSPRLVLVGPPGAGKTTVGRLLAERLGVPFADTDDEIVARAGKPVTDIFIDDGEDAFRALERTTVADGLAGFDGVLALGGGAVLAAETRERLAGHPVVFLATGVPASARRVGLNRDRPLLLGNPRAQLRELLDARLPLYREVAAVTVETDDLSPGEVADAVLAALETRPASSPGPGASGAAASGAGASGSGASAPGASGAGAPAPDAPASDAAGPDGPAPAPAPAEERG